MDIKAGSVVCILLIFFAKLVITKKLSDTFSKVWNTRCGMITAWGFVYLWEILLMLVLSFGNHLTQLFLWILFATTGTGIFIVCSFWMKKWFLVCSERAVEGENDSVLIKNEYERKTEKMIIALLAIIIGFWMFRSFVYFDTTWDALVYEMPRIFQFSTGKSLFINQDAIAKNIFVNEWNGELNAIFYRILTGDNISISFGNVETLFYGMLAFYELGKAWLKNNRFILALAFISMPVNIFLSFTVKSDLLGCICLPVFLLMLFLYWRTSREGETDDILLVGCMAIGALGTGARITLIPAVGCAMVVLMVWLLKNWRGQTKRLLHMIAILVIVYAIAWARYIINFVYYGNPFERCDVPNEKVAFTFERLINTSKAYFSDMVHGSNILTESSGTVWALVKDAGIIGPFIVIGVVYLLVNLSVFIIKRIQEGKLQQYLNEVITTVSILGCYVFLIGAMDYYDWSFRYYMPYLGTIIFAILIAVNNQMAMPIIPVKGISKNIYKINTCISYGVVLLMGVNLISSVALSYRVGEVTGSDWKTMLKKTEEQRRFAFHPYFLDEYDDVLEYINRDSMILVCTGNDEMSEQVYGGNADNQVVYTEPDNFESMLTADEWDAVLISPNFGGAQEVMDNNLEYVKYYEGTVNLGITYLRADKLGVILTPGEGVGTLERNDDHTWTWNELESLYTIENFSEDIDKILKFSLGSSTDNAEADVYISGEFVETVKLRNGGAECSYKLHLSRRVPVEVRLVYKGETVGPTENDSRILGLIVTDIQLVD